MAEIFPSSDVAVTTMNEKGRISKYPWMLLKQHESFSVQKSEIKLLSLRSLAYKYGKRHNKMFVVIEHDNCYEVARKD